MSVDGSEAKEWSKIDCLKVVRSYRPLFAICCAWGAHFFLLNRFLDFPGTIDTYPYYEFYYFLRDLDYMLIPRSFFELNAIYDSSGSVYFICATLSEFLTALSCIVTSVIALRQVFTIDRSTLTTSNTKVVLSAFIIVVGGLLWRPIVPYGGLKNNTPDPQGIYFLRESIIEVIGYYYLTILIANIGVSLRDR